MRKPNVKKCISIVLFVVLAGLLAWYVYQNRHDMAQLLKLDAPTVAWMLVLALGACVMNAVYHKLILDTYHMPLDVVDWLGVVFVANTLAFVLPMRADLVFSATYYKRTKGFAYVKSVSVAAGNVVFGVLFALIQMLAALLCIGLIEGQWPPVLWLAWAAAAAVTGAFLVMSLWFQERMPAFLKRSKMLMNIVTGFNDLLRNRLLLCRLLVCLTLNCLFHLFLYMACFSGINMDIPLYQALFYAGVSRLLTMVAIVPGNIGVNEAVLGVAGSLMGDVFQNGVMVSLLRRVTLMIVYIVVGLLFAWPVWKRWSRGKAE